MIVRADTAVSFLIEFPSAAPDGNIDWKLYGPSGAIITTGSVVVPVGAVSANVVINSEFNVPPSGSLMTFRDVEWSYTVAGSVFNGEERYSVEARVPFGASTAGVRTKLGIEDPFELPDAEISLVSAYADFAGAVSATALLAADPADLRIRNAIEALAALSLVPSLSVRLAKKEDSGTRSFSRQDIDWGMISASLSALVRAAYLLLDPNYDETVGFGALFILAAPAVDAITGAEAG